MKPVGIVRKVDELGRIVIPKELRKIMGIEKKQPLEIFTCDDGIVLRKYSPECIRCGETHDLIDINNGTKICKKCLKDLNKNTK